jgi:hypothetical protein
VKLSDALDKLEASLPTPERWRALAPALLVTAMSVLSLWIYWGVFHGEVAGDDNTFHFAEAARIRDCFAHHDFDLWNPSSNSGFATGYYYQLLPAMVPAIGSWLLGGSILFWFQLGVFVPFVLAPIATYRGMRMMKMSPWEACGAAIALAMCAGGSKWGFNSDGTFSVGLYTQGWAFVAFPLALGHGARWIDEGRSLGPAAVWGLFVGLSHPVAGVALGIALFAGELGRWVACGWHALRLLGVGGFRVVRVILFAALLTAISYAAFAWGDVLEIVLVEIVLAAIMAGWWLLRDQVIAWWERPLLPSDGPAVLPAFGRLAVLGAFLLVGSASAWLPVLVDYIGFGGFPHRVGGEDGWHLKDLKDAIGGHLLDEGRLGVLTMLVPLVAIFVRASWLPRLWAAAISFFAIMMIGPQLPKGSDDLFPAIRVLGGLQVTLALAVGGGFVVLVARARTLLRGWSYELHAREILGAIAGAIAFSCVYGGTVLIASRARAAQDYPDFHREELPELWAAIGNQMQGREQVRAGAEAHWSNLLPFVYEGRNAMLQMGGAGLQSSPNYVFLWEQQDPTRSAYIYDAPLVILKADQEDNVSGGTVVMKTAHYELKEFPASGLVVPVHVLGTVPIEWDRTDKNGKLIGRYSERDAIRQGIIKHWLRTDMPMRNEVYAYPRSGDAGDLPEGIVIAYSRQPSGGDDPDITADVQASKPTTFEVKESWHPRWVAFVDGQPATIRRVTPDYMALDVPAGRHHLAWRFDRPLWTWLIWLLWPAMGVLGWAITRRLERDATRPLPAARAITAPPPVSDPAASA